MNDEKPTQAEGEAGCKCTCCCCETGSLPALAKFLRRIATALESKQ